MSSPRKVSVLDSLPRPDPEEAADAAVQLLGDLAREEPCQQEEKPQTNVLPLRRQ